MSDTRRARFRELHATQGVFVMPNAWDVGSARLLAAHGFTALATTSAGHAWTLGKLDQQVTRDELIVHVSALAAATPLPLSVDSERLFPDDPGGVAECVRLLADAGAAGCSIEDYDPATGRLEPLDVAVARVGATVEAAHGLDDPIVVTARCENHLYGLGDIDDTIARLVAYVAAGADVAYAPWLKDGDAIARLVAETGAPVNVLAVPGVPPVPELGRLGVRRVSSGGHLASAAYGALLTAADELAGPGTSTYVARGLSVEAKRSAFGDTS
jgi:2-methylisocitrate lyase-like PEP mutase family enzyme